MMRLGLPLAPLALASVVVGGAGCSSDGDKRAAGDAADGGTVVATADAVDAPKPDLDDDKPKDEPSDAGAPDAGDVIPDAGVGPIPVVAEVVDSGTMADVEKGGGGKAVIEGGTGKDAGKDPITFTVWNRLLVKAKAKDLSAAAMQELVEKATGQKVEKVRKTAGTFWLVQFAPTTPVRKKEDQAKLVETLKGTGAFATVEGDQVMTLKTP